MKTASARAAVSVAAAVAILLAVTFAGWGSLLIGHRILFFGDIALYFTPLLQVQGHALRAGRLALWDPYVLCGRPLFGNPQAWPLYPSAVLLALFPAEQVTGMTGALHLFWAALGTLLFLRRRGLGTGAALLGAIAWGFGGALVSKMQFPNMVQAASWLPWLLFAAEGILNARPDRRPRATAGLALAAGLSLLAAHPQMFLMAFYVVAAWCLWRLPNVVRTDRLIVFACLSAALVAGVLLAMVQLLPTAELARVSVRPDLTLAKANRFILPPYAAFYNFLLPNFFGNPATAPPMIARGNYWEACAYMGLVPVAFAVGASIRLFRKRPDIRFWLVIAVLCLWLSLGRDAFLYAAAFRLLPGLSRFHDAARWLIPGTFALACLAAHGLDSILKSLKRPAVRRAVVLAFVFVTAADLLRFGVTLNPAADPGLFRSAQKKQTGDGRLFHLDEGRVWSQFISYRSYETVEGSRSRAFVESGGPNLPEYAGQREFGGYEPVARADIWALAQAAREQAQTLRPGAALPKSLAAILRAGGVTRTVRLRPGDLSPVVEAIPDPSPRAQFVTRWESASTTESALQRVLSPDWSGIPIVTSTQRPEPASGPSGDFVCTLTDKDEDNVIANLPPFHPSGLLALADTRHPGWTVEYWGSDAPIGAGTVVPVNGAFRGVFVPKGVRSVAFRYEPDSVRIGMFVSLCAAGILMAVFAGRPTLGRASPISFRDTAAGPSPVPAGGQEH